MIIICKIEEVIKVINVMKSAKPFVAAIILDEVHLQSIYQVSQDNEDIRTTLPRVIDEGIHTLTAKQTGLS